MEKTLADRAQPLGAYPHLRRAGEFWFVSGLSARQADNSIPGVEVNARGSVRLDIAAQTRAVLDNLAAILGSVDATLADVVELTTFLVDMNDFVEYNRIYGEVFATGGPARTTVAVHQLPHPHLRIEIRAVVWKP